MVPSATAPLQPGEPPRSRLRGLRPLLPRSGRAQMFSLALMVVSRIAPAGSAFSDVHPFVASPAAHWAVGALRNSMVPSHNPRHRGIRRPSRFPHHVNRMSPACRSHPGGRTHHSGGHGVMSSSPGSSVANERSLSSLLNAALRRARWCRMFDSLPNPRRIARSVGLLTPRRTNSSPCRNRPRRYGSRSLGRPATARQSSSVRSACPNRAATESSGSLA